MAPSRTPALLAACYPTLFGAFLCLALIKFGNPVILNARIPIPGTPASFLIDPWPLHWAYPLLILLVGLATLLHPLSTPRPPTPSLASRRLQVALLVLPAAWLAWQCLAARQAVDTPLAATTLPHLAGVVACFYIGWRVLARLPNHRWIWLGLALALVVNGVRATNQRLFEFPGNLAFLEEGDRKGWAHVPVETVQELMADGLLVDGDAGPMAHPLILAKLRKARVHGTMVYPNALANLLLLLAPPVAALAWGHRTRLRPRLRLVVLPLGGLLLVLAFLWTDSKAAWLVALAVGALAAWQHLPLSRNARRIAAAAVALLGLCLFAWRFHAYLAAGAASAAARLDYWRAALQVTRHSPSSARAPAPSSAPMPNSSPTVPR